MVSDPGSDGGDPGSNDIDENFEYRKTVHYWEKGKLATVVQTFLDIMDVLEDSDLTKDSKDPEKAKVLAGKKHLENN